jgi:general stress protein 26
MDSINQQQPEKNHQDLQSKDAIAKIQEVVKQAQACFFTTKPARQVSANSAGQNTTTRPMSPQQVDDKGNLWFLSSDDSNKNRELAADPSVSLYFQGSPHSDFLHLEGRATLSRDKAKIKELWKPILKTWFTEGEDDPRITVIQVTPSAGYYWDNKHGNAVAGVKMMIGAAIGKTLDDSIEGTLKV